MNDELNEEIQELKKELEEYSNELDKLYSLDNTNSQKTIKAIEEINKGKKELEQKIDIVEKSKNSINNEYLRLLNYYKKYKKKSKKSESEESESEVSESESESEESDYLESEEIKKFNEELMKKYNIDDTKTTYDSNGFDKDGKHKNTGIFLNKKNINWLKDEDEFLKLYNEIIKNGEFSEKISEKKNVFHHMILKIFWKVY